MQVSPDTRRRLAVAALVGHCETIAASGLLGERCELSLRHLIAETLAAYGMPSLPELNRNKDAA